MADVEFQDFSLEVKAAIDSVTIGWMHDWANEIVSQAARNCAMDGELGQQLAGSYYYDADDSKGIARVGTRMEAGYWEEYGTGEYAAKGNGRKGWWIYIEGQTSGSGGMSYATQEEAEQMAAYIRQVYGKAAIVTNGRRPAHTLEKAFTTVTPQAQADLEEKLKARMGGNE